MSEKLAGLFNTYKVEWLDGKILYQLGISLLQLVAVIIMIKLLLKLSTVLINKLFQNKDKYDKYTQQRNDTLETVLESATRYILYFIGVTMSLEVLGIPTTSVLAGAGVIGLAVGFGAQSLVKDVITGFFILFEKQFVIGDYIKVADKEGIVDEIGLRVTKVKNFDGDLHIIPNGNIGQVTNLTANSRRVLVDAAIDYDQDIQEATAVLENLCEEIKEEYSDIINDGPKVLGVQELAASSVNIRIVAMAEAMESWQMQRTIKQKVKERFDEVGIDIPYNHLTVVDKE
ncbi:MAG: mechanosensitive ion channel family protein [Bacillota bacterium]